MSENNNSLPQYNRVDSNGFLYIFQRIKALFVAKETGKGLSTNDFTDAYKNKIDGSQQIAGIQRNGTDITPDSTTHKVNVEVPVLGVQRNGTDLTPNSSTKKVNVEVPILGIQKNGTDVAPDSTSKKVNLEVPLVDSSLSGSSTNAVQNKVVKGALDLKAPLASPTFTGTPLITTTPETSDNSHKVADTAFVKNAIANALSGQLELHFDFRQTLPASGVEGTFYFIPADVSETDVDEWEEYVWDATNSQFERVGAATLDLSNYFNTTNLPALTNQEIDSIITTAMS